MLKIMHRDRLKNETAIGKTMRTDQPTMEPETKKKTTIARMKAKTIREIKRNLNPETKGEMVMMINNKKRRENFPAFFYLIVDLIGRWSLKLFVQKCLGHLFLAFRPLHLHELPAHHKYW